jgi:hypothetical protein
MLRSALKITALCLRYDITEHLSSMLDKSTFGVILMFEFLATCGQDY